MNCVYKGIDLIYEDIYNNKIDIEKIINILEGIIKNNEFAHSYLDDVYLSHNSIKEEESTGKNELFKKMYNIRVANHKSKILIGDILNHNQKIHLLKLSIENCNKNISHPLNHYLLPTKFKLDPELLFLIIKHFGYILKYSYYDTHICDVQKNILKIYILSTLKCYEENVKAIDRFLMTSATKDSNNNIFSRLPCGLLTLTKRNILEYMDCNKNELLEILTHIK